MNVADYIVAFLGSLGVRHIFGYPGSPLVPFLAALERQEEVRWVLMRHENAAAMAAGAHGRLTGELGVCVTTSGPGALNALCGVVDADLDRVPLLVITGLVPTAQVGHWEFQDVDQSQGVRLGPRPQRQLHPSRPAGGAPAQLRRTGRPAAARGASRASLRLLATQIPFGADPFHLDPALLPRPLR